MSMNYETSKFDLDGEQRVGEWENGVIIIKGQNVDNTPYKAIVWVRDSQMECLGGDGISPIAIETPDPSNPMGPRIFKSDGNGTGEFVVNPGQLSHPHVTTHQRVP